MKSGENETADLFRVLELFKGTRRFAVTQSGLSLVEGFCEAAILTLFARLALGAVNGTSDSVFIPGFGVQSTSWGLTTLLSLVLVRFISGLGGAWCSNRLQFSLVRSLRLGAIESYSVASWSAQSSMDQGALQQLVVSIPNSLGSNLAGLISYFSQIVIMLAMLSYAFVTDPKLTGLLVLVIGLSTFLFKPLRHWIRQKSARALIEQQRLSRVTSELSDMKFEIQAFGVEREAVAPVVRAINEESSLQEAAGRIRGIIVPSFTSILYLSVTFGLLLLANSSTENFESTGPVLLVVLRSLSYGVSIQQAASGIAVIIPSLNAIEEVTQRLEGEKVVWGDVLFNGCDSLKFKNVCYSYPGAKKETLKDVNIDFHAGGKIGIVGPSGGGKSTLIRLALGVIPPTSGEVLLNGTSIRDFERTSLAARIAVVPQYAAVFEGSIADNLTLFRETISERDMKDALEIADLRADIEELPDGLESVLGPGHLQLSGGQQQRLAIARAFSGRPDLVVMDEPTSSVDSLSEVSISEAIGNLPAGVTLLIVSHRMKILEGCDQLVVIENGRVSAVGDPEEILNTSEYVRALDLI